MLAKTIEIQISDEHFFQLFQSYHQIDSISICTYNKETEVDFQVVLKRTNYFVIYVQL